jgi:hypothetical protein
MNQKEAGAVDFAQAIAKLTLDSSYRSTVEADPSVLLRDFPGLTVAEIGLLLSVWQAAKGLTGAEAGTEIEGSVYCCCCCPRF